MRSYCELPRMDGDTKSSILGAAASDEVSGKRLHSDIRESGQPFSHCEVKPLTLWQRICEHHSVAHIVDFAPGSAALAIAAADAMVYEGVAANDVHREWLDSTLDRCAMYMAGQKKWFAQGLGGDQDFIEKVQKYFAGTMMEARRLLEPPAHDVLDDYESSDGSQA